MDRHLAALKGNGEIAAVEQGISGPREHRAGEFARFGVEPFGTQSRCGDLRLVQKSKAEPMPRVIRVAEQHVEMPVGLKHGVGHWPVKRVGRDHDHIKKLAKTQGWAHEEFDLKALRKLGAGAFVAVAQGSSEGDAAIVHLSYRPESAEKTVALVGKGICFDTGGHNLKPARYMQGMHEDMNGSVCVWGFCWRRRSKNGR